MYLYGVLVRHLLGTLLKKIHLISFQIVAIWSGFSALRDPSQVLDIDKSKWVTTSFLYIDILLQLSRHSVYWYIWWDDKHKTPLPSYWLYASGLQYPNGIQLLRTNQSLWTVLSSLRHGPAHIEGILPKGPYLPCVSMAGRALLAGYPRYASANSTWIPTTAANGLLPGAILTSMT